jgi:hypothetical protein
LLGLLLFGVTAQATLIGVLLPLLLALGVVEDSPYHLLAGGKVGGIVQEFPGGAWALMS